MLKSKFSFKGRIRRMEYGISYIIYYILTIFCSLPMQFANVFLQTSAQSTSGPETWSIIVFIIAYLFYLVMLIPLSWFMLAQGAKRCHDRGCSGWWQLVPFYFFWLVFADGVPGSNEYGENPKGRLAENNDTE